MRFKWTNKLLKSRNLVRKVETPNLAALIKKQQNKAYTVETPAAQLLKHQRKL